MFRPEGYQEKSEIKLLGNHAYTLYVQQDNFRRWRDLMIIRRIQIVYTFIIPFILYHVSLISVIIIDQIFLLEWLHGLITCEYSQAKTGEYLRL